MYLVNSSGLLVLASLTSQRYLTLLTTTSFLKLFFVNLKCPQTLLLSFFPLYAFLHSFFHHLLSSLHALLSILIDLSIIFGLSVPKYVGKMLLTSAFLPADSLARNMFSLLILIYQVSVWICLFQRILTLSGLDHIFPF